jgi:hypothetical protein
MFLEKQDANGCRPLLPYNLHSVLEAHFGNLQFQVASHLPMILQLKSGSRDDMEKAKITTDHEHIKQWVEERGGHPARVKGTAVEGSSGVLLIDYPGYSGTQILETISWDEFFKGFEQNELAFLYQDEKQAGSQSRFSKLINRDPAQQSSRAA